MDVENTSANDVVLTTLTDTIYGDLNGMGNCQAGVTIAVGAGSWLIVFDANNSVAVPAATKEGRGLLMVLLALLGEFFLYRFGEGVRKC